MEDIKEIKDILQFILQADDIGHDSSFGSDIITVSYTHLTLPTKA